MVRRRRLLRALGTAAAGGVIAGCQDVDDNEEPEENDTEQDDAENENDVSPGEVPDRVDFPELSAGEPTYYEWIPTGEEFDLGATLAVNFSRVRAKRDELPPGVYENLTASVTGNGYFGVDFEDLDGEIFSINRGLSIYPGEFDRAEIRETLRTTGHERYETRGTVSFYRQPERGSYFAVGERGIISPLDDDAGEFPTVATRLFETAAGERPRRRDVSESFRRFTEEVGWPLQVALPNQTGEEGEGLPTGLSEAFPSAALGRVSIGLGQHLVAEGVVDRWWLWTPTADESTRRLVRTSLEDADFAAFASSEEAVAVRHTDRVSEIARIRRRERTGGGLRPPQFALSATVSDGVVVLSNRAGDPAPLEHITVRSDGDERTLSGTLKQGDSTRVEGLEVGDRIYVVYSPPHTDTTTALLEVNTDA